MARKKPTVSIKAKVEGYSEHKIFTSKTSNEKIQADFSFTTYGGSKYFTDVSLKKDNPKKLVSKQKVLRFITKMKKGRFPYFR